MRFETIPANESRQINGPFFGLRVLVADLGARLSVNRLAFPVPDCLPAFDGKVDTITATGPITLALADSEGEDIARISATAAPAPAVVTVIDTPLGTSTFDSGVVTLPRLTALAVHLIMGSMGRTCTVEVMTTEGFALFTWLNAAITANAHHVGHFGAGGAVGASPVVATAALVSKVVPPAIRVVATGVGGTAGRLVVWGRP